MQSVLEICSAVKKLKNNYSYNILAVLATNLYLNLWHPIMLCFFVADKVVPPKKDVEYSDLVKTGKKIVVEVEEKSPGII